MPRARGRDRPRFRQASSGEEIAPWWPFPPGALARPNDAATSRSPVLVDPDRPDAVLDAFDDLDVAVRSAPFREVIRAAYEHLCDPGDDHERGLSR